MIKKFNEYEKVGIEALFLWVNDGAPGPFDRQHGFARAYNTVYKSKIQNDYDSVLKYEKKRKQNLDMFISLCRENRFIDGEIRPSINIEKIFGYDETVADFIDGVKDIKTEIKAKTKNVDEFDIQSLTYRVFDLIEPHIKQAIAQALQEHLEPPA